MEDRLKNLRKSMNRTTFSQLNFTEKHRKDIREKIKQQEEKEEDVLFAVLQLLVNERTGFELVKLLRGRGIRKFEDNEGSLYILLHRLEQNQWIQATWQRSKAKYYQLTNKGKKILQKAGKNQTKKGFVLHELLEG
ncbi:PadR family transcriptional regulator [Neobacillus sp. MM2021_6]|uniref:PadR family transcriptional regulator n=1 Tax=Bacillaceae TaxID=186817 RepID=UPI0014072818|nr:MULTISPECIES: PadR family transcriptional regulator [Bacillaceae]MBO0960239.1 PadR family transcriptional regulator [Neobacillus sp. MM2021_6]NHC19369.1 PadR family transcriptional regulator [Bacillus sp. MM2020_4]